MGLVAIPLLWWIGKPRKDEEDPWELIPSRYPVAVYESFVYCRIGMPMAKSGTGR